MASHPNQDDAADNQDSIAYSHSVVTYLDLLGFRALVEREPNPNEINDVLNKLYEEAHVRQDLADSMGLNQIFASDSVIRVRQSGGCEGITSPGLQHELLMLAHIQASLIGDGIVVRGGITCGNVYLSGNKVFGPAYQEAYRIESKVALYPRIVVDHELLERFVGYPEGGGNLEHANARHEVYELLSEDDDGEWFLDYLRANSTEFDHYAGYLAFLRRHKELIVARLTQYEGCQRVYEKYRWLRAYHNEVVEELDPNVLNKMGIAKSSLLVPIANEELPDGDK